MDNNNNQFNNNGNNPYFNAPQAPAQNVTASPAGNVTGAAAPQAQAPMQQQAPQRPPVQAPQVSLSRTAPLAMPAVHQADGLNHYAYQSSATFDGNDMPEEVRISSLPLVMNSGVYHFAIARARIVPASSGDHDVVLLSGRASKIDDPAHNGQLSLRLRIPNDSSKASQYDKSAFFAWCKVFGMYKPCGNDAWCPDITFTETQDQNGQPLREITSVIGANCMVAVDASKLSSNGTPWFNVKDVLYADGRTFQEALTGMSAQRLNALTDPTSICFLRSEGRPVHMRDQGGDFQPSAPMQQQAPAQPHMPNSVLNANLPSGPYGQQQAPVQAAPRFQPQFRPQAPQAQAPMQQQAPVQQRPQPFAWQGDAGQAAPQQAQQQAKPQAAAQGQNPYVMRGPSDEDFN